MTDHCDTEVVRQRIRFDDSPILLNGPAATLCIANETPTGAFMQCPWKNRARKRLTIILFLFHRTGTKVIQSFAKFAAFPINPCGQVASQVAPRATRLCDIGECYINSDRSEEQTPEIQS